jgi:hypothetical protein
MELTSTPPYSFTRWYSRIPTILLLSVENKSRALNMKLTGSRKHITFTRIYGVTYKKAAVLWGNIQDKLKCKKIYKAEN